jgi:hypothetical protein
MLQLPAIFLQQVISTCVIWGLGRHASAGVAIHTASKLNTIMERTRAMARMLHLHFQPRKAATRPLTYTSVGCPSGYPMSYIYAEEMP